MIPLNIGTVTGTTFGSSDELSRIKTLTNNNFEYFRKWFEHNPEIFQNDELLVQLITIVQDYINRGLNVRFLLPNLAQHLQLVYRNQFQRLHQTHLGNLLIIPTWDNEEKLFTVLYSDAIDLNYNREALISTTSFVTINIKYLVTLLRDYRRYEIGTNEFITMEMTIPLHKEITNWAVYNKIVDIRYIEKTKKQDELFYIYDVNKFVFERRGAIERSVSYKNMQPLDVLANLPISDNIKWQTIDDEYIDNLLWINLFTFHNIVTNAQKLNNDKFYRRFFRSYSLYEPRGRGDKYFGNTCTKLLDYLQDTKFI